MPRGVVIGTRGSKLALVQAETVLARLRALRPSLPLTISKISTTGDRDRRLFLEREGDDGVFVKELEDTLLDGRIDIAVHSLKDLPTLLPPGLRLAATLEREDPRDVLVSRAGGISELPPGARIGTGSPRRSLQLLARRPDLQVAGIRGNVDTRLRKVASGEFDGIILAAAALRRLGWEDRITEYLSPEQFLPAVGQGAMGIEIRDNDAETAALVSQLNHLDTWRSVLAERAFLREVGGGCRAPIAGLGTVTGDRLHLEGMVASPSSVLKASPGAILRASEEGRAEAAEELGLRLARRLLDMGAREFVAEAKAQ